MTKTVKITSRGRYVCPDGKVLFGPTGNWFKENTDTLKALLIGYPNIDIVERTESKKIVNINIENVNTNNESEPVSMMEDVKPVNKDAEKVEEPAGEAPTVDTTEHVDEAPVEEVPAQETPVEETSSEVQTNEETAPVEDTAPVDTPVDTETTEEPADEVPTEDATKPVDEAPAEEVPTQETPAEAEKTADTTANTQAQTQSKKNKKRHNKSTEVTPKEA